MINKIKYYFSFLIIIIYSLPTSLNIRKLRLGVSFFFDYGRENAFTVTVPKFI